MFKSMKRKHAVIYCTATLFVYLCGTQIAMGDQGQSQTYRVPTDKLAQVAFDAGLNAYQNKDYATALKAWTLSANAGDIAAAYNIGLMYQSGTGIPQDTALAMKWLQVAAEDGDYDAQIDLAKTYLIGYNVGADIVESKKWLALAYKSNPESASADLKLVLNQATPIAQLLIGFFFYSNQGDHQSYPDAFIWFSASAKKGQMVAQYMVGAMYASGLGIAADDNNAIKFLGESAAQGYPPAQNDLGVMFQNGEGVPRNYAIAFKLINAAANQGLAIAQTNLCRDYIYGNSISRDMVQAYKWCNLAAAQGEQDAVKELDALQSQMSQPQIALAQKLSTEWAINSSTTGNNANNKDTKGTENEQTREKIRTAQTLLVAIGYDAGIADGVLGPRTIHAILAFESKYGLAQDGLVSDSLIAELAQVESQRNRSNKVGGNVGRANRQLRLVSTGTGFYVTGDGYLITNAHVVRGCAEINFSFNGTTQTTNVLAIDNNDDLALLKSNDSTGRYVTLRGGPGIRAGENIVVLGYPLPGILSGELTVTSGLINALSGIEGRVSQFQFSAPIQPGNSGGPILDSYGNLVGITEAKLNDKETAEVTGSLPENVNFGINENTIRAFLDAQSVAYSLSSNTLLVTAEQDVIKAREYSMLLQCWK